MLLTGIAIGILFSQQQRLVFLAVNELNKQLPGRLLVSGSEISAFQNFPYVSIALKNVHPDLVQDDNGRLNLVEASRISPDSAKSKEAGAADLLHDNLVDLGFSGDRPDFKQLFSFATMAASPSRDASAAK